MSGEGVHVRTFLGLSCVSVCAGLACRGAGGAGGTCSRGVCKGSVHFYRVEFIRVRARSLYLLCNGWESGDGHTFSGSSCVDMCWVGSPGCGVRWRRGGTCSRGVFEVGARPERVLRPHTCWCVQALLLGGIWATCCLCCAFCEQRNCCDPSWELVRASG